MRGTRGLGLLEVVGGVALAGLVGRIGVVQLPALVQRVRLVGAAHQVGTTLRGARGRALARGDTVTVRIDVAAATLDTLAGATPIARLVLPAGVAIAGAPAAGRIAFGGLGTAQNGTITLASGAAQRRVVVNQRGRVRIA